MPKGSNILSMSMRFLGQKGKWLSGAMFIFLYYCLMVAYFAAGAPLLGSLLGLDAQNIGTYLLFGAIFGAIVAIGPKWIDRSNMVLTLTMVVFFFLLIIFGMRGIDSNRFVYTNYKPLLFASPFLFSAFGFHNIIPPLTEYLKRDVKVLRRSIVLGTLIPLIFYILWQVLIIGSIPQDLLSKTLAAGEPVTSALPKHTYVKGIGDAFGAVCHHHLDHWRCFLAR